MKPDISSISWLEKYLRLTNYLGAAQIYLKENFLLEKELKPEHIKDRLLGHWGTVPGLNFIWAGFDYLISKYNQKMLAVIGPGHGYPAIQANLFVENSIGEYYNRYEWLHKDREGRKLAFGNLIKDFSWPGGVPSHSNPYTPGCILEGGELGYALSTSYGAAFDDPSLLVGCVVGDGEAETGPAATSWHSNKYLNPETSGAVLPIVHINGYKISSPTIYGNIPSNELITLFEGYGYDPILVEGEYLFEPFLSALDSAYQIITSIQDEARTMGFHSVPKWPVILLKSPKGWFGPKYDREDKPIMGSYRSHGIPLKNPKSDENEFTILKNWLESYKIHELLNDDLSINDEVMAYVPKGAKRMGMNPEACAHDTKDLILPRIEDYQVKFEKPGSVTSSSMEVLGKYLRDVFILNDKNQNFRLFCPDETESNKLDSVFEATNRAFMLPVNEHDEHISKNGRIMEMLSEHTLEGWLQGYILTGRHGMFASYESFIEIVSSMVDQYIKFLRHVRNIKWRNAVPSLNFVLTSLSWRQDHNGFSHQNPGFISSMLNNEADFVSAYFPPDANSLLCVAEEVLKSRNKVNLIIAGKQNNQQWLDIDEARTQISEDIKIWDFVSDDDPDVVLAGCGDYVMREILASRKILKKFIPGIKLRIVNVSEITSFNLGDNRFKNPKISELMFDEIFTPEKPVIFNYHGTKSDIGYLLFNHHAAARFSIHGYSEVGTTTTPFDILVMNKVDRYNVALETFRYATITNEKVANYGQKFEDYIKAVLRKHKLYINQYGNDLPEFLDFVYSD